MTEAASVILSNKEYFTFKDKIFNINKVISYDIQKKVK